MANRLDYDALRAQTIRNGNDEAVTVNTRALIDKVLARYSGEWTTLRELLQNAADASARKVTIRLQTMPSSNVPAPLSSDSSVRLKHVIENHTLKLSIIENDGEPFKATDWSRLKKIAEGNPDETKIGAFGVGFYSVFADCEEPFVSSGKEALAFYWKEDSLFTRKLQLENDQSTNTTFVLPMRNASSPVPQLLSLCQFLSSSLTFVGLEAIELWLDEWRILRLKKVIAPSIEVSIPKEVERKTREGLMQVVSVSKEAAQLDAHWLKAVGWERKKDYGNTSNAGSGPTLPSAQPGQSLRTFFSRLAPGTINVAAEKEAKEQNALQEAISGNVMGEENATIFLHVNKATVRTLVGPNFASELERATKKPPPRTTTVSLLTASYDESAASTASSPSQSSRAINIFSSVLPTKGRIFIGFPTNQTTGLNAHISTPSVIPTVERESIDLNNQYVRVWNIELLRVAGIIARISWSSEMVELGRKLLGAVRAASRKRLVKEDIANILPEALFLHKTFTWKESTPSSEVGTLVEEAFWTCNKKMTIDVLSSRGVLPSSRVRISTEDLGFVEGIPVLPDALANSGLIRRMRDYGVITEITISDIKLELEGKALNAAQLQQFLEWLGHKARIDEIDTAMIRSLLNVAVANDDGGASAKLIVLSDIKNFLNVSRIPAEMPSPPTTMPFKFTKKLSKFELDALGWEDLQMVPWLRWIVENAGGRGELPLEQDLTNSSSFASAVLPVISKQWDGLSPSSKTTVIELLIPRTVIPTKMGMRKPSDAYFPSVKLFDDLPIVTGLHSVKDKLLSALGVRKTIEIGVVFERLMATSSRTDEKAAVATGRWSHVDLIKYLASVRSDIPSGDIKRLKSTKICPIETDSNTGSDQRYLISDIFEPSESLRGLQLPILQWPGLYRAESAEGKFLASLGLRAAPSYMELISIMAKAGAEEDFALRDRALKYFVDHHQTKSYANFDHKSITMPYLPLQSLGSKLAIPTRCFTNDRAAILGFHILRKDLHVHALKFGVQADPPIQECIDRLTKDPPQNRRSAREIFGYFAGRLAEINSQHTQVLSEALIVPVASNSSTPSSEKAEQIRHIPPRICFLGDEDKYADIFDYVDFGQEANTFLLRCGSKHEPSTTELAYLLTQQPARVFTILEIPKYLELLRNLAEAWRSLKKDKALVKELKKAPFLLASKEVPSGVTKVDQDEDDETGVKTYELASASQIVIVDDIISYNLFKMNLLAAPMEESLENLYTNLGSPELGSLIEEQHSIGSITPDQNGAVKLQRLVQERSRLFLHDHEADAIRHDAKWIERYLSIVAVKSISLRKSLKGTSIRHNESRTAATYQDKQKGWVLYVTARGCDLYEVSQVLVPLLLNRSKPQNVMMFEMLLDTDLRKLGARGYNVQRILRQQATENRIAEEARKKQLEQEQQQLLERETLWNERQAQNALIAHQQASMPGVFPDSPDHKHPSRMGDLLAPSEDEATRKPRGLFSSFSEFGKRLGLENGRRPSQSNVSGGIETPPPPYTQEDVQKSRSPVSQPEVATAPHQLQQK